MRIAIAIEAPALASTTTPLWPVLLAATIAALAAIMSAVIAGRYAAAARHSEASTQRMRDLENRIAQRKYETYEPMIELFRRMLDPKDAVAILADADGFRTQITKFSAWIAIYGGDDAVIQFERFMQCTFSQPPLSVTIRMYAEFVLAARRDMGYPDTRVTGEHLLGSRLNDLYTTPVLDALTMPLQDLYAREHWTPPWEKHA